MVVRSAVSLAVRQTEELVLHPRRAAGQLVAEVGGVVSGVAGTLVGVGDAVVGRVLSTLTSTDPTSMDLAAPSHTTADPARAVDPEDLLDRPGPVPPELLEGAATPAPRPAPPRARRTARKVGEEIRTPSGIPAAGPGLNPSTGETDLVQPGTEPIMDPATTKAVAAEARMMRRAASREK